QLGAAGRHHRSRGDRKPSAVGSELGAAGRHGTAQTTTDVPGEIPNTAQMLVTPAPGPATSCLTPATRPRLLARIRTGYS
ncbi:hypothetical protein, partial [Mycobacterium kansasii]